MLKYQAYIIVLFLSTVNLSFEFKCEKDGLFEDENDCRMYFECLWIGTQFERSEHLKCAETLIYNPIKHRCDDSSEFEAQFANGILTQEDLIQFIRYRNCVDSDVYQTTQIPNLQQLPDLVDNETISNNNNNNNNNNELYLVNVNGINLLNETSKHVQMNNTLNKSEFNVVENKNETEILNSTTILKSNETKPTLVVNIKASKLSMNITSNDKNATSAIFNSSSKPTKSSEPELRQMKILNENIVNDDEKKDSVTVTGVPKEDSVYVMEDEKMYFGKKVYLESQNNKNISGRQSLGHDNNEDDRREQKKLPSDLATHMSVMKIFIRRRVLKTTTPLVDKDEEIRVYLNENTTISNENETIFEKRDSKNKNSSDENEDDEFIKRAKNRPTKNFPYSVVKKRKILSIDESTPEFLSSTATTSTVSSTTVETTGIHQSTFLPTTENQIKTEALTTTETKITNLIENVEQLTKQNTDNGSTKQRIQQINSNLLIANVNKTSNLPVEKTTINLKEPESSNIKNLTFLKFLRVNNINDSYFNQTIVGRKPIRFVKMLKKPNITFTNNETTVDEKNNFHTLKPIFIKPNQTQYVTLFPQKNSKKMVLSEFESLVDVSKNQSINANKTSKKMRVFHLKPLEYSSQVNNFTPYTITDSTKMVPLRKYHYLYKNLKGRLSGNGTKSSKLESFVVERNNITRINELEKGGQFQRMLLQPADALIECKDNDFGLECSCSITLSPPKCKQLINSFLSSCRIVGCQNNGRCINMAYKYPIPYVCSCPSSHMGSYCEIQRDITPNTDYEYFRSRKPVSTHPPQLRHQVPIAQPIPLPLPLPNLQPHPKVAEFKEPICQPNPCFNHGICEIIAEHVTCTCVNASFTGELCEVILPTHIHALSQQQAQPSTQAPFKPKNNGLIPFDTAHQWNCPSDCNRDKNQGRCVLSILGYPKCVCNVDWSGVDCSQKNYCLFNDCLNNATCSNLPLVKSYICLCARGFSGRRCEVMSNNFFQQQQQVVPYNYPANNPCGSVTCANNGTCLLSFSRDKNQFSFICKCKPGFSGLLCEIRTSDCDSKSCSLKEDTSLRGRNPTKMPNSTIEHLTIKSKTDLTTTESISTKTSTSTTTSTTSASSSLESTSTTTLLTANKKISNLFLQNNPCKNDPDLCRKYPYGNDSFVCIRSLKSHDYTLCLPIDSVNCEDSNPCLNDGKCVSRKSNDSRTTWKCICNENFTGSICETEICSNVHKTISNHTMCLQNSLHYKNGGLEPIDIELILDMHNSLRRQVMPTASNMQKMYWDLRLQQLAQKRAQLCSVDIDNVAMRQLPGYGIVIGENLAAGYDSWAHVLSTWIAESRNFVYDSENLSHNIKAGHYTQMIYSGASRIGCGYAQCSGTVYSRYFVCYYAEMQTYQSHYQPYQSGNTCAKCPNHCNEGLCDCKGVYCANGGTLDLNTCKCSCPPSGFTGEYCEKIICPKQDSPFCSQALFKDKCWLYPVVRSSCPFMCQLCNKENQYSNSTSTASLKSSLSFMH